MEIRTYEPSQTLGFGKYRDQTAAWVSQNDPRYLRYLEGEGLRIQVSPAPIPADSSYNHEDWNDRIDTRNEELEEDEELYWTSMIGFR